MKLQLDSQHLLFNSFWENMRKGRTQLNLFASWCTKSSQEDCYEDSCNMERSELNSGKSAVPHSRMTKTADTANRPDRVRSHDEVCMRWQHRQKCQSIQKKKRNASRDLWDGEQIMPCTNYTSPQKKFHKTKPTHFDDSPPRTHHKSSLHR